MKINNVEISKSEISKKNLMVAIGFGQSISSNNAPTKYECKKNVYNYDIIDKKFYKAVDPLKNATGTGGSVWSRMGDKLIDRGYFENIIFITLGVDGSSITKWTKNGDMNKELIRAIKNIKEEGFEITHLLWHHGSSDVGKEKNVYKNMFSEMLKTIRDENVNAPIFVSIHTGGSDYDKLKPQFKKPRKEIQDAQRELVNGKDIFQGPDTDKYIGEKDRLEDKLHFNDIGYDKFADLWIESIVKQSIRK